MIEQYRSVAHHKRRGGARVLDRVRQLYYIEHFGRISEGVIELPHVAADIPDAIHEAENINLDEDEVADGYKTALPEQYGACEKGQIDSKCKEPLHPVHPCITVPYASRR